MKDRHSFLYKFGVLTEADRFGICEKCGLKIDTDAEETKCHGQSWEDSYE